MCIGTSELLFGVLLLYGPECFTRKIQKWKARHKTGAARTLIRARPTEETNAQRYIRVTSDVFPVCHSTSGSDPTVVKHTHLYDKFQCYIRAVDAVLHFVVCTLIILQDPAIVG